MDTVLRFAGLFFFLKILHRGQGVDVSGSTRVFTLVMPVARASPLMWSPGTSHRHYPYRC